MMNTIKAEANNLMEYATDEIKRMKRLFPTYFKSNDPFSFGIEKFVFDQLIKISFVYQNFDSIEEVVNTIKYGLKEPVYDFDLNEMPVVFRLYAVDNEILEEITIEEMQAVLTDLKGKMQKREVDLKTTMERFHHEVFDTMYKDDPSMSWIAKVLLKTNYPSKKELITFLDNWLTEKQISL